MFHAREGTEVMFVKVCSIGAESCIPSMKRGVCPQTMDACQSHVSEVPKMYQQTNSSKAQQSWNLCLTVFLEVLHWKLFFSGNTCYLEWLLGNSWATQELPLSQRPRKSILSGCKCSEITPKQESCWKDSSWQELFLTGPISRGGEKRLGKSPPKIQEVFDILSWPFALVHLES